MNKLLLIVFLCVGCDTTIYSERASKNITYVKDSRTGLCFIDNEISEPHLPTFQHIYTNVPCNKEVEELLKK